jgi:hypothetical protein
MTADNASSTFGSDASGAFWLAVDDSESPQAVHKTAAKNTIRE